MKIIDIVSKLDKMVAEGKIMEAFEEYFHENVITHSSSDDRSTGKAEKREFLKGFFDNMVSTDEVTHHDTVVDEDKTFSAFTFKFTNKQNEVLSWKEIIRRTWAEGLVVDEYYFNGDISDIKKEVKQKAEAAKKKVKSATKASPKAAHKAKAKTTTTKKAAPAKKAAAAVKQNLKLVEGIGPKIEQLLKADGINTFDDLAKAKITKLQAVLTSAGPRFSFHKADTWPQQAQLLADGKTEELKKLQDELKGGRKA